MYKVEENMRGCAAGWDASYQREYDTAKVTESTLGLRQQFEPKERKRRTMQEQIGFNIERIAVLHKEFTELKQMLNDYIIQVPQCEQEGTAVIGNGEANSEMMYGLLRETTMINELILYVSELKRDLQL